MTSAARLQLIASAVLVALGGVVAEVVAVRSGWSVELALLDACAGTALLLAAVVSRALRVLTRWLCLVAALLWFVATLAVVGGGTGHAAGQVAALWLAPLVTVLLGAPAALPRGRAARLVCALVLLRAAVPVLAATSSLTLATGVAVAGVAAFGVASTWRSSAVWDSLSPGTAAVGLGLATAVAGALDMAGQRPDVGTWLVSSSVVLAALALLAVPSELPTRGSDLARLVVDLGRSRDARSQEQLLAQAMGDRDVRLLYRLGPGLPFVDSTGLRVVAPGPGRTLTVLESAPQSVVAALEHRTGTLDNEAVRAAVAALGALTAQRLQLAAVSALQSTELAASRRRLVEADGTERERFAEQVAARPQRHLAEAITVLEAAARTLGRTSAETLPADLGRALDEARAARDELTRTATGDLSLVLGRRGLATALADLAATAGASARIDDSVASVAPDGPGAATAWFVVSEALTNALRYAGAARLDVRAGVPALGRLEVEVEDDGIGGADPEGSGLRGLRTRVTAVGGSLTVGPATGAGTLVWAQLPVTSS